MCGIWFCLGDSCSPTSDQCIEKLKSRGPEDVKRIHVQGHGTMAFTRLAINGLTPEGMQPFQTQGVYFMCNGEIYNWKYLAEQYGIRTKSGSDCEVLGHLYLRNRDSIADFFRALDGVFALVIVDTERNRVILGRDPYGVRPLFVGDDKYFASEVKGLVPLCEIINPFPPGTFRVYDTQSLKCIEAKEYTQIPFLKNPHYDILYNACLALRRALESAVDKRMLTERPVACLLSGGLDSSLIASLVSKRLHAQGLPPLKTFSIGMPGSTDIEYARKVAAFIKSDHTELVLSADAFFEAIPHVIRDIESYDTTTVRASVGNWLISKYIREHTDCKVVFNGDGSDEVFGSYLYFYNAPNDLEYEKEVRRLLKDIHSFDVLRSDRSISSHGLEPRTPFLDRQFVEVALSISTHLRRPLKNVRCEKYILRKAFEDITVLPPEVLWRTKEAFSDGVSSHEKSWYQIIQEKLADVKIEDKAYAHLPPTTKEMAYYRFNFEEHYRGHGVLVPYFWMPKWCEGAKDPSARTLKEYSKMTY